jgi:UDP-2,4-diacetamido-2,4,6-trideoxy-beta-L-altropyranose hydrolase
MTDIIFIPAFSSAIGIGHLMRSLNLARLFQDRGANVKFFAQNRETEQKVISEGFECSDKNIGQRLTVIDDYSKDYIFHNQIKVGKIMVIDDLANRKLNCDFLLDSNLREDKKNPYLKLIKKETKCFLGIEYIVLNKQYYLPKESNLKKYVLVFLTGGNDKGLTLLFLKLLVKKNLQIKCVVGSLNPNLLQILKFCFSNNIELFIDTKEMASLVAEADFCIGSFGTSTWERLFFTKPTLGVELADNQAQIAKIVDSQGLAINLGKIENITEKVIENGIVKILSKKETIRQNIIKSGIANKISLNIHNMIDIILLEI